MYRQYIVLQERDVPFGMFPHADPPLLPPTCQLYNQKERRDRDIPVAWRICSGGGGCYPTPTAQRPPIHATPQQGKSLNPPR